MSKRQNTSGSLNGSVDLSTTAMRATFLRVINSLTEDASPDKTADFLIFYDVSEGVVNKVKINAAFAGELLLDRTTVEVDVANTAADTALYSFSVPGGTLGTQGKVRLLILGDWLHNNGAGDTINFRVIWDGTAGFAYTINPGSTSATRGHFMLVCELSSRNATNAQMLVANLAFSPPGTGDGVGAVSTNVIGGHSSLTADSTTARTLSANVQWSAGSGSNSIRLKSGYLMSI